MSCGCRKLEILNEHHKGTGVPLCGVIRNVYKARARKMNLPWSLTNAQFAALVASNCHYCGGPPSNVTSSRKQYMGSSFTYNGIDRKNNSLGYVEENVVPCCKMCNWAKGKMEYEGFIAYLERIKIFRT